MKVNPNSFTIAGFKSESIFNFIMTKALRLKSNETHCNYLIIVNLIDKFNNLRNREFNDIDRKMLQCIFLYL